MQKLTTRLYRLHENVDDQIIRFLVEKYLDICRVIFLICLQATNMNKLITTHQCHCCTSILQYTLFLEM